MITFSDSSLLTSLQNYLSSQAFLNCIINCGKTPVSWELKPTTKITIFFNNRASDTLHSLIIQIIEMTLSAYFHGFFLLLQINLYSIPLDKRMLCDPPVTSFSEDLEQTNEQLPPPY